MFSWCKGGDSEMENEPRIANGVAENHSRNPTRGVLFSPTNKRGGKPRIEPKTNLGLRNKIVPMTADDMSREPPDDPPIAASRPIRNYSGGELADLGFPVYDRNSLAKKLPNSVSQPLAVLDVLTELADETLAGHSVTSVSGRGASFHKKHQNKVVPMYTNSACEYYFGISSYREYAPVIRKLLKRDPLLTFALQKALRFLKVAEMKPVNHVTPDPSGQTSTLFGMRITPCVWEDADSCQPALLMEHNVPYNPAEVMPRLMRDYAVLSHVPAILTLIDFHGKVLYQNASSLAYMGDLLSAKYDKRLSQGLLRVLFFYDPENLEQLLEDVLGGMEWQGVVGVPSSLRRFLASGSDTLRDAFDDASSESSQTRNSGGVLANAGPRLSQIHDELEKGKAQLGSKPKASAHNTSQSPLPGPQAARTSTTPSPDYQSFSDIPPEPQSGPSEVMPQSRIQSILFRANPGANPETRAAPGAGGRGVVSFTDSLDQVYPPNRPEEAEDEYDENRECYHEVHAIPLLDPVLDKQVYPPNRPEEAEDEYDENRECYHEVHAIPLLDPVLDKQVIMLVQTDVTPRVELENRLADLTEAQLSMLGHMFPRHIIEYMLARVPKQGTSGMKDLANTHDQVSVLFCDVVGFTSMSKEVEPSQVSVLFCDVVGFTSMSQQVELSQVSVLFCDVVGFTSMSKEVEPSQVSVLFCDVVGFTSMSKEVEPSQVLHFLNELYEVFDDLLDEYGMYKMDEDQVTSNAVRIMQFAKAMLRETKMVLLPHNSEPVKLRIGIHTGKLVSGLIGSKMPKFTLFGDTMNTASRMESTCRDWEPTGGVEVKGKGLMQTRLWVPNTDRQELLELDPDAALPNLRNMLRMHSFTSTKSRVLADFGRNSSFRSRRGSMHQGHDDDDDDEDGDGYGHLAARSSNALMAILQNIRGGGEEEERGSSAAGMLTTGGSSGGRPKSAYSRPGARGAHRVTSCDRPSGGSTSGRVSHHGSTSRRPSVEMMGSLRTKPSVHLDDRRKSMQVSRHRSSRPKKSVAIETVAQTFNSMLLNDASYEPLDLTAFDPDHDSSEPMPSGLLPGTTSRDSRESHGSRRSHALESNQSRTL
eukprot:gene26549-18316_t